jgi:probable HAF family extracellular repeat protein
MGRAAGFFWSAAGEVLELGSLGTDTESIGFGINDDGFVVGVSGSADGPRRAFRWSRGTGMLDLGVLPGTDWSIARAIGNNGRIVGSSGFHGVELERAFVWTESGGMRDLGALQASSGVSSGAYGVNFLGKAVGFSWNGATFRAVIFPTPQ